MLCVFSLEKFNIRRFPVGHPVSTFAVQAVESPSTCGIRREYDAYVATLCRDGFLDTFSVPRCIVAGRTISHEQVLVHSEETVAL